MRCVATSSSVADYISLADRTKEVMSDGEVLDFLRPSVRCPPEVVFEDTACAF